MSPALRLSLGPRSRAVEPRSMMTSPSGTGAVRGLVGGQLRRLELLEVAPASARPALRRAPAGHAPPPTRRWGACRRAGSRAAAEAATRGSSTEAAAAGRATGTAAGTTGPRGAAAGPRRVGAPGSGGRRCGTGPAPAHTGRGRNGPSTRAEGRPRPRRWGHGLARGAERWAGGALAIRRGRSPRCRAPAAAPARRPAGRGGGARRCRGRGLRWRSRRCGPGAGRLLLTSRDDRGGASPRVRRAADRQRAAGGAATFRAGAFFSGVVLGAAELDEEATAFLAGAGAAAGAEAAAAGAGAADGSVPTWAAAPWSPWRPSWPGRAPRAGRGGADPRHRPCGGRGRPGRPQWRTSGS